MFAVRQAVAEVLDTLPGSSVMVKSDNRTVVSFINNQGGTKSLSLLTDTGLLLELAQTHSFSISARYLPGKYNGLADILSRQSSLPDWHLSSNVTQALFQRWGLPGIGLFASRQSAVVRRYAAVDMRDLHADFSDAFSRPWNVGLAWVFPPSALMPRVLQHLNLHRQREVHCDRAALGQGVWRPDLKRRAIAPPAPLRDLEVILLGLATGCPPQRAVDFRLEA